MPTLVWWIIAVGFVAPAVVALALYLLHRFGKGNDPRQGMNLMWGVLVVLLALFLGVGLFTGAQ